MREGFTWPLFGKLLSFLLFPALGVPAFVTLDTSTPAGEADSARVRAPRGPSHPAMPPSGIPMPNLRISVPDAPARLQPGNPPTLPPPGTDSSAGLSAARPPGLEPLPLLRDSVRLALHLSGEAESVPLYLGFLRGLEMRGLRPDLLLADGMAALPAAGWAMGYDAAALKERFRQAPPGFLARPLEPRLEGTAGLPPEVSPYQLRLLLRNRSADPEEWRAGLTVLGPGGRTGGKASFDPDGVFREEEFPHLDWFLSRLLAEAPQGPTDRLEKTAVPLFLYLTRKDSPSPVWVRQGDLLALLRASGLPVSRRDLKSEGPDLAPGRLLAGGGAERETWPIRAEKVLWLRAPTFVAARPSSWQDSVLRAAKRRGYPFPPGPGVAVEGGLPPGARKGPGDSEEEAFEKSFAAGFAAALALSRDTLPREDSSRKASPIPPASASQVDASVMTSSASQGDAARLRLAEARIVGQASEGDAHLRSRLHHLERHFPDTAGYAHLDALVQTGFFRDIGLGWEKAEDPGGAPVALLAARERPNLALDLGAAASTVQGLGAVGVLSYAEPFYLPYEIRAAGKAALEGLGYGLGLHFEPLFPVHFRLGAHWRREFRLPFAPLGWAERLSPLRPEAEHRAYRLFFRWLPGPASFLELGLERLRYEERQDPGSRPAPTAPNPPADPGGETPTVTIDFTDLPGAGLDYRSLDLYHQGYLGFGEGGFAGRKRDFIRWSLKARNPDNEGTQQPASQEGNLEAGFGFGPLRLLNQVHASTRSRNDRDLYDLLVESQLPLLEGAEDLLLAELADPFFLRQEGGLEWRSRSLRLFAGAGAWSRLPERPGTGEGGAFEARPYWRGAVEYAGPFGSGLFSVGALGRGEPVVLFRLGGPLNLAGLLAW